MYDHLKIDRNISFTCQPCISSTLPFSDLEDFNENIDIQDNHALPVDYERINVNLDGINIAHLNINGLRSKIDFLKIFLLQEKLDVICLNETKIDSTVSDGDIKIPGYNSYRQDRTLHGGGTLIYAADYLNSKKSCRFSRKDHEAVWIEVKLKKVKPIFICSLYRPPSPRDIEQVEKCCAYLSSCADNLPQNTEVIIMGDFNVDMSKRNTLSLFIKELCRSKNLTQHVTTPTRVTNSSSSLIDLAISNSKHIKECKVVDPGMSDHSLIYLRRDRVKISRSQKTITSRSYKNFDEEKFLEGLGNLDWSNVLNTNCLDNAANAFNENILKVLDKHAPLTTKRVCSSNPPWVDESLLSAINERDYLKKSASKSGLTQDWDIFKRKRNQVNSLKNQLKRDYYQTTLKNNKKDPRTLWKTLNNIIPGNKNNNSFPQSVTTEEGIEISDKKEIAKTFNDFFSSVGSKLAASFNFSDTSHINPPVNENPFSFSDVTKSSVQKLISKLDNNKATGLDGISVRALKAGSPILSYYLTYLFNMSLSSGYVPKCWKKKRVTPVFKKGNTDDPNNYRPISILPVTMKIFEKVVHQQVVDFLDLCNILSSSQSGFRNAHSTDTAVICVSDFILDELSKGNYVGAVLVDLKKAFDTVDHQILLKKLFCYGFRDISFDWFNSYLSDREQCTILDATSSTFLPEDPFGVPQGSVLGPLLFLLYINDINQSINPQKTFHHLYADDTIIIQSSKTPVQLKTDMNQQLLDLSNWFIKNKLSVNASKTEVIFFGRPDKVNECKTLFPLSFQNKALECRERVKYLGVTFEESMSWNEQVKSVRKKAYHSIHKIQRISNLLDVHTKKLLLNALVMPHINYCCSSWSSMSASNNKKFESLMKNIDKIHPMNRTFKQISDFNKSIMTFKGINNIAPDYLCSKFKLVRQCHNRVTRFSVQNNLTVPLASNSFKNKTFISTSTPLWNNLPAQLKTTNSILTFKSLLRKHIFNPT